nr:unnamed protein product [Callosobruchus analis]
MRNKNISVISIDKRSGYVRLRLSDINIFCCYCSPNIRLEEYESYLEALFEDVASTRGETIILGDLNAKSIDWGAPSTDRRGKILCEWLATMDMVVMNDGLLPTFSRRTSQSFIDVTFATQELAKNISKWEVLDEESLSDHRYIYFEVNTKCKIKKMPSVRHTPFVDIDKFEQSLAAHLKGMPASNNISVSSTQK